MSASEQLNTLIKEVTSRFSKQNSPDINTNKMERGSSDSTVTPQQLLVVAGILAGLLDVDSILVDKNQTVEIILSGTLKRKTQLDKMLEQVGSLPFDEVVKSIIGRL